MIKTAVLLVRQFFCAFQHDTWLSFALLLNLFIVFNVISSSFRLILRLWKEFIHSFLLFLSKLDKNFLL